MPIVCGHFWNLGTVAVSLQYGNFDQTSMCATYIYLTATVNCKPNELVGHTFSWEQIDPLTPLVNWVPISGTAIAPAPTVVSSATSTTFENTFVRSSILASSPIVKFRFWVDKGLLHAQHLDVNVSITPVDIVNNGVNGSSIGSGVSTTPPFINTGINAGQATYRGTESMAVTNYVISTSYVLVNAPGYVATPSVLIRNPTAGTANLQRIRVQENTTGTYVDKFTFTALTTNNYLSDIVASPLLPNGTYRIIADYNYGTSVMTPVFWGATPGSVPGLNISAADTINNGVTATLVNSSSMTKTTILYTRLPQVVPTDIYSSQLNSPADAQTVAKTTILYTRLPQVVPTDIYSSQLNSPADAQTVVRSTVILGHVIL